MQIHRQRQRKSVDLVTAADETQMDSDQHTLCDFLCTKWIILPVRVDAYPLVHFCLADIEYCCTKPIFS